MLASLHLDPFSMPHGVKCLETGILADECWITSVGTEIVDILRAVDIDARSYPGPLCLHRFETYDFVAMYPNIYQMRLSKMSCGNC